MIEAWQMAVERFAGLVPEKKKKKKGQQCDLRGGICAGYHSGSCHRAA